MVDRDFLHGGNWIHKDGNPPALPTVLPLKALSTCGDYFSLLSLLPTFQPLLLLLSFTALQYPSARLAGPARRKVTAST